MSQCDRSRDSFVKQTEFTDATPAAVAPGLMAKLHELLSSTRPAVLAGHWIPEVYVGSARHSGRLEALAAQSDSGVHRLSVPSDPAARVRFVRDWVARHHRKVAAGGLASTLVLPLLAQATELSERIALEALEGIAEASVLDDGSLALRLEDGRTLRLAAEQVAEIDGQLHVETEALLAALEEATLPIDQLPLVSAAVLNADGTATITLTDDTQLLLAEHDFTVVEGEVGVTPAQAQQSGLADGEDFSSVLGQAAFDTVPPESTTASPFADLSPVQIVLGALGIGAVAAAAGGGGGSSTSRPAPNDPEQPATIEGYVIDGYVAGINVDFLDADGNVLGSTTTQGGEGNPGFFSSRIDGDVQVIEARGGGDAVDISTGLPFTGTLQAPPAPEGPTILSPLTTLLAQDSALTEDGLKEALGLDKDINLLTADPIASVNAELLVAGVKVAVALSSAVEGGADYLGAAREIADSINDLANDQRGAPDALNQAIDAALDNLDVPVLKRA
ncbi:MAG: hypothetical protein ACOC0M_03550, partial [Halomonas sp.]